MVTCTYSKILVVKEIVLLMLKQTSHIMTKRHPVTAKKLSKFETLLDLHTPAAVILWK